MVCNIKVCHIYTENVLLSTFLRLLHLKTIELFTVITFGYKNRAIYNITLSNENSELWKFEHIAYPLT